ncbi:hypothetical protein GIB67_026021 [Kingdonia uniflora]|uniref:Polymerase/histidinol phosphatase N-terminal domain-containing protein n=1 Tax=Kingdonia uniflora TaxID=39325 RepID=A0A7J7M2P7_9MAGN|nr:hypothetical protein GIB67_026021 [Kingdonia uniflora]
MGDGSFEWSIRNRPALGDVSNQIGRVEDSSADGFAGNRPALVNISNQLGKRKFVSVAATGNNFNEGGHGYLKILGGKAGNVDIRRKVCGGTENLLKGKWGSEVVKDVGTENDVSFVKAKLQCLSHDGENSVLGRSRVPSQLKEFSSSLGGNQCFVWGEAFPKTAEVSGPCKVAQNSLPLPIREDCREERGVRSADFVRSSTLSNSVNNAVTTQVFQIDGDDVTSNKSSSIGCSIPSGSSSSKVLESEKCTAFNADSGSNTGADPELLKDCSCSFCLKAAYIWSDLHYQDTKGRIAALKRSRKEIKSVLDKSRNHPNNSAKLESDLMLQWRSLFLHTEGIIGQESTQLQSNLAKLKVLRENCKNDLGMINVAPSHKQRIGLMGDGFSLVQGDISSFTNGGGVGVNSKKGGKTNKKKKNKNGGSKKKKKMSVEQSIATKFISDWVSPDSSPTLPLDDFLVQRSVVKSADKMVFELHSHTICSDGFLSPKALVERANRNGVKVLALTDHDTMSGIPEALEAARRFGMRIIPGVEISTIFYPRGESGEEPVHILAYYGSCGPKHLEELESCLANIRDGRYLRAKSMLSKLNDLKMPIKWERVVKMAGVGVAPGRLHVARALVEAGHVENLKQAFSRYLYDGGPAYSTGNELGAEEAVQLICRTGGFSALAHPWALKNPVAIIRRLKDAGLHGMEVYRSDGKLAAFSDLADTYHLVKLGGSDYHGKGTHNESDLGSVNLPVLAFHEFLKVSRPIWCDATRDILESFAEEPSILNLERLSKFGKIRNLRMEELTLQCGKDVIDLCLSSWLTNEERHSVEFEALRLKLSHTVIKRNCIQLSVMSG